MIKAKDDSNHFYADPSRDYYPMCLVWSPIPFLTTFIPVIGHLGISTSQGEIQDFAGPYYINVCDFDEYLNNNLILFTRKARKELVLEELQNIVQYPYQILKI